MDDEYSEKTKRQANVLELFESAQDPVLTTEEVANGLGISRDEAYARLSEMEANGMVESKQEVWWARPVPYLEGEAIAMLQPSGLDTQWDEPLSIEQIRNIICDE